MVKKRFVALLLAVVMVTGCLVGCGKADNKENTSQSQTDSSVQTSSDAGTQETKGEKELITTEPVTISILTTRHTTATNDASECWYFKYLEYWFAQQGYDVTIEVQQTMEKNEQIALLLGTDSLPDLVWGIDLGAQNAVQYGMDQGIVLDWAPYINEETMPNLCARLAEEPDALMASTLPNEAVYGLPFFNPRAYGSGCFGTSERLYISKTWLEQCGQKEPKTMEELLDVLRAFKENITLESGEDVIPLISNGNFWNSFIWTSLGYYGYNGANQYGTTMAIKDGQLALPAYTEDYRAFVEIMNTCYKEGLISQDYFTMDSTTARGLMKAGNCGALCDWTLSYAPEDWANWVCVEPMTAGNNDDVYVSAAAALSYNRIWASAKTEYPEILAMLVDYLYSDEGAFLYRNGPAEGEDPLNMVDGWYIDEEGAITTKMEANGTYSSFTEYARQHIYPIDDAGIRLLGMEQRAMEMLGMESTELETISYTDAVTGRTVNTTVINEYTHEDNDGHWRLMMIDTWTPHATTIVLPPVYLSMDDALRAKELSTLLKAHISSETAAFITGARPLSEVDDYFAELKSMGAEEFNELYKEAHSTYMDTVFK